MVTAELRNGPVGARIAAGVAAGLGGWFWLPCPVCGEYFSGQEWQRSCAGDMPASVPVVDRPGLSTAICPACTREGYGYPLAIEVAHWIQPPPWRPAQRPSDIVESGRYRYRGRHRARPARRLPRAWRRMRRANDTGVVH